MIRVRARKRDRTTADTKSYGVSYPDALKAVHICRSRTKGKRGTYRKMPSAAGTGCETSPQVYVMRANSICRFISRNNKRQRHFPCVRRTPLVYSALDQICPSAVSHPPKIHPLPPTHVVTVTISKPNLLCFDAEFCEICRVRSGYYEINDALAASTGFLEGAEWLMCVRRVPCAKNRLKGDEKSERWRTYEQHRRYV